MDATKQGTTQPAVKSKRRPTVPKPEAIKQLTLYLNAGAHRELRLLAIDQDTKAHSLLVEGLNDLFQKYGRKPVAVQRVRSKH